MLLQWQACWRVLNATVAVTSRAQHRAAGSALVWRLDLPRQMPKLVRRAGETPTSGANTIEQQLSAYPAVNGDTQQSPAQPVVAGDTHQSSAGTAFNPDSPCAPR